MEEAARAVCQAENLSFESFVGSGAFKRTFRVRRPDTSTLALKVLDPTNSDSLRLEREIDALETCSSPRLSKFWGHGTVTAGGVKFDYLLEEFFAGGTMTERLPAMVLKPDTVRVFGTALAEAIQHLKLHSLVHRDIKPDNIMFRIGDELPVLTDFGLVRDLTKISLTGSWFPQGPGTPFFSAPEQLNNETHLIGWKTDPFSVGGVLGYALTGSHPFARKGDSPGDAVAAVAARKQPSEAFKDTLAATGLTHLLRMLQPWPINRLPSPEAMVHAFAS